MFQGAFKGFFAQLTIKFTLCIVMTPLANSEVPDEKGLNAIFHQDLHCFPRQNIGSEVVECLTRDRGAAGSSLTALCP